MFLKRSLVLLTGILLFIGAYLLTFRLSDARLENTFRQERVKYGVQGIVLTAAQPSFAVPAPSADVAPATAAAPAPAAPAPTPDTSSTPPGAATDTNVIIGPVPPSSVPDTTPMPSTPNLPTPSLDTNGGPIAPNTSTQVSPRTARWLSLVVGATETNTTFTTNAPAPPPVTATELNIAHTGVASAPTPTTNNPAPAPATTNVVSSTTGTNAAPAAPAHAVSAAGRAIVLGFHQFTGPGVPSKNIYSMSQDVFISEMKYLHDNGYNIVPLSDVVRFVKHEIGLPPNAVAITIDDGYKSAVNYAFPVLKQYGYPATFFVYPAFITRTEGKGAASWPDLVELQKEGFDIECHSMTHPQLTSHRQKFHGSFHSLTPEEYDEFLTDETSGAKAIIEKELGKTVKYFAYPYGAYNQTVEAKAVAAGFEAIFTVADNPVHITTDVHSIGRYIITKPVERLFAAYLHQGALSLAQVEPAPGATTSNPRPVITAVLGFTGDPKTLETSVRDFGIVKHDFDPATSTVRIYLPRDLIQPEVLVSIRARDLQSGQTVVANWHFNYEPVAGTPAPIHQPIATPAVSTGEFAPATNAPAPGTAATLPATNGPVLSSKNPK